MTPDRRYPSSCGTRPWAAGTSAGAAGRRSRHRHLPAGAAPAAAGCGHGGAAAPLRRCADEREAAVLPGTGRGQDTLSLGGEGREGAPRHRAPRIGGRRRRRGLSRPLGGAEARRPALFSLRRKVTGRVPAARLGGARAPLKRGRRRGRRVRAGRRRRRAVGGGGCGPAAGTAARSLPPSIPRSLTAAAMSREPEIMESQVMWEPDTKRNTHMDRFRAAVAGSCGLRLGERRAVWGGGGERGGPRALAGAGHRLWGPARRGWPHRGAARRPSAATPRRGGRCPGQVSGGGEMWSRLAGGCSARVSCRGLLCSISLGVKVNADGKRKQPYLWLPLLLDVSPGSGCSVPAQAPGCPGGVAAVLLQGFPRGG